MIFLYETLGINIPILSDKMNAIVVEDKMMFSHMIQDLWKQTKGLEGHISISETDKKMNIAKDIICIINPFDISLNDKKIITQVYKELHIIGSQELIEQKTRMNQNIIDYFDLLISSSPYPLNFDFDIDEIGLYKLCHLEFQNDNEEILDNVTEYIKLFKSVCNIKLFIFVSLKSFLTREQYQLLYDTIKYEEVCLLDISNEHEYSIDDEKGYIIDKDLCIIELN